MATRNGLTDARVELLVTADGALPLYLQIKHQLSYMISSGQVAGGARLPPVRVLARDLGVDANTVGLAYRQLKQEGFLASAPGRGTFVVDQRSLDGTLAEREQLAMAALDRALQRCAALGFPPSEAVERLSAMLVHRSYPRMVVLIAATRRIARKYANSVERAFDNGVRVVPFGIEAVTIRDSVLLAALSVAYDVVTFTFQIKEVREALSGLGVDHRVLGISGKVTDETVEALRSLPADASLCLLAQERFVNTSLHLLKVHARRVVAASDVATESDPKRAHALVAGHELVVFNTGILEDITDLAVPASKRVELVFDIDRESIDLLAEAWNMRVA